MLYKVCMTKEKVGIRDWLIEGASNRGNMVPANKQRNINCLFN